ncbi:MAG TPA: AGE family epimerase/isomerase [Opitutus sp.]|nr:AGE family epimerase/isomerase [Opitutus sp.]
MNEILATLTRQYRDALLHDVLPFWERHSPDPAHGGYFTCLARDGSVYDTDKFVWLQARQVWMFASLYNRLEKNPAWLALARSGAEFLRRHAIAASGDWYFSLTRDGRPLVQPCNIFSDCFGAIACSQFALASGDDDFRQIARATFDNIVRRQANPKGAYNKLVPGTRPAVSLALPMILLNVTQELAWQLEPAAVDAIVERCRSDVFSLFLDERRMILHEHVAPDGAKLDTFEGRTLNPGHALEAMWFIMDLAAQRGDRALAERAVEIALRTLALGWDGEHGGIFYFLDARGHPPQQLEWDQKLWWVHLETLVTLLKGFRLTGNPACWSWFERVHDYAWRHFPDPQFGEWFGYLDRRGEVLLSLKGGKWKGCFHVPRALHLCWRELELLNRETASAESHAP